MHTSNHLLRTICGHISAGVNRYPLQRGEKPSHRQNFNLFRRSENRRPERPELVQRAQRRIQRAPHEMISRHVAPIDLISVEQGALRVVPKHRAAPHEVCSPYQRVAPHHAVVGGTPYEMITPDEMIAPYDVQGPSRLIEVDVITPNQVVAPHEMLRPRHDFAVEQRRAGCDADLQPRRRRRLARIDGVGQREGAGAVDRACTLREHVDVGKFYRAELENRLDEIR